MARKVKFPLHMANGADVRTLDDLIANFDLTSVLGYYSNGKLLTWLKDHYCDVEAAKVEAINPDGNLAKQICAAFGIEPDEETEDVDMDFVARRNEKKQELLALGATKEMIDKIDFVALNQDDLIDCLDSGCKTIYLAKGRFIVPLSVPDVTYIGVFDPTVVIRATDNVDFASKHLTFQDVHYFWDATGVTPNDKTYQAEQLMMRGGFKEAEEILLSVEHTGNPRTLRLLEDMKIELYHHGHLSDEQRKLVRECSYFTINQNLSEYIRCANDGTVMDMYLLALEYQKCENNGDAHAEKEKVTWYRKLAEKSFVIGQHHYGLCYYFGSGVEKNYSEAVKWLQKAAEQGLHDAAWYIGECYSKGGYGIKQDYELAAEWYEKGAETNSFHQYVLGCNFLWGNGVDQDCEKAVKWLQRGSGRHKYSLLGECYYYGEGTEQDYARAIDCYRKGVEEDNERAMWNLGVAYSEGNGVKADFEKAAELYEMAAEREDAYYNQLGERYLYGDGVEVNEERAFECFQKAADSEDEWGQYNLADCYKNGDGVEQDDKQAVYWYQKAADQGLHWGLSNLAYCYYYGKGVAEDEDEAVELLVKSVDQGYNDQPDLLRTLAANDYGYAQYGLGVCYFKGYGVEEDEDEAVEWLIQAADNGIEEAAVYLALAAENGNEDCFDTLEEMANDDVAAAQYGVGICYYYGYGTDEDEEEAAEWFVSAIENEYNCDGYFDDEKLIEKLKYLIDNDIEMDWDTISVWLAQVVERTESDNCFDILESLAEDEFPAAQYGLGLCYYNGYGADVDEDKGVNLIKKAAEQEYDEAQEWLAENGYA